MSSPFKSFILYVMGSVLNLSAYLIMRKSTYRLGKDRPFYITDENGKPKLLKREIRFVDSYRFMGSSLETLVNNLGID